MVNIRKCIIVVNFLVVSRYVFLVGFLGYLNMLCRLFFDEILV